MSTNRIEDTDGKIHIFPESMTAEGKLLFVIARAVVTQIEARQRHAEMLAEIRASLIDTLSRFEDALESMGVIPPKPVDPVQEIDISGKSLKVEDE